MKFVVFDRREALMGGLDVTLGRWDTQSHLALDMRRFRQTDDVFNSTKKKIYMPWHDISVHVKNSENVKDLVFTFIQVTFFFLFFFFYDY